MKSFNKSLPTGDNVKGSNTGEPAADVNKVSDALVEIRSNVPSTPADVAAATDNQLVAIQSRLSGLLARLNKLRSVEVIDNFSRTALGSGYFTANESLLALNGSYLSLTTGAVAICSNRPTKTSQMYAKMTVAADSATGHPSLLLNFGGYLDNSTSSNYRINYNISNSKWELIRRVGGVNTIVATSTTPAPSSYNLKLSQYNGVISAYLNDTTLLTYNDSSPLSAKFAGIYLQYTGASSTNQRVDDFAYGDNTIV